MRPSLVELLRGSTTAGRGTSRLGQRSSPRAVQAVFTCHRPGHLYSGTSTSSLCPSALCTSQAASSRCQRGFASGSGSEATPFGRNWAAGLLQQPLEEQASRPRRPRSSGHLSNRLLGALSLLRDPRDLDGEGLGKAATAAAREGLADDLWWESFTARTKELANNLAMHDVSLILNGMARARRLDKKLVEALLPRISGDLVYMTSAHLAMLSSSIAKAEVHNPQFVALLTRELKARLMEFHSSMELTMIINAVSKLRVTDEDLYRRFVTHIQSRMGHESFHVRDVSVIVGALARVNCADSNTMARFADCAVQTLPQATPLELARLMHACMSVGCHVHDLYAACVLHNREQAMSMDPSGLSAAAFAFGQCLEVADVEHLNYLQKIFRHLRLASVASLPLFLPREIVSLLRTYARWQIAFECGHLRKVADRMVALKGKFDLELSGAGLHALAILMQRNSMRSRSAADLEVTWKAVSNAAASLLEPVTPAIRSNKLDLPSALRALESATVLRAGSPELVSSISECVLRRGGQIDGPSCLSIQEHLGQLGVSQEDDLMLVLSHIANPAMA